MHRSILIFLGFSFSILKSVTIVSASEEILTAHSLGRSLAKCLGEPKVVSCIENETIKKLDILLRDNSTWRYSDGIQFEKDNNFTVVPLKSVRYDENAGNIIAGKILQLAQARSIRLKVSARSLEEKGVNLDFIEGGDDNARKKQTIWYLNHSLKGRKKKDKNKSGLMMGGMAVMGMIGQMFLGKAILIASAAFVMAKIALLVSLLTSLKMKSSGSGSTDHVVTYTDAGGGHGHGGGHSGWHRSLPFYTPSPPIHTVEEIHHEEVHHEEEPHESPQFDDYYPHEAASQKNDYKFI